MQHVPANYREAAFNSQIDLEGKFALLSSVADLKSFYALLEGLVPAWLQICSCCIFDLAHANEVGAVPLQVCFLQALLLSESFGAQIGLTDQVSM